jgi:hypothetical protein
MKKQYCEHGNELKCDGCQTEQEGSNSALSDMLCAVCEKKDARISELEDLLKMAYCKEKGSDSIVGLDCCDDYRDWCATLST